MGNYLPTLVALNQTSYLPQVGRTISVREALKLQSFPEYFDFGEQSDAISFKQLGNSVSVSAVRYVFEQYLKHFQLLGI
jgi:DNA (cytosine-5)-methyltransferase 1